VVRVSKKGMTDEVVGQVAADLRARYGLDADDIRALGARLAEDHRLAGNAENVAFAERFTDEHAETFHRLAQ